MRGTWREIGDGFTTAYARSAWRLPLLVLGGATLLFLPLYLLRGLRLVEIGLLGIVGLVGAGIGFVRPFFTLCLGLFVVFSGLARYLPGGGLVVGALLVVPAARALCDLLDGGRTELGTFEFGLALGTLFAAILTSLLVVQNFQSAAQQGFLLGIGLLLYFTLSRLADAPQRIVTALVAVGAGLGVGTLVVLRGLFALRGLELLSVTSEVRFGGLRGDPNVQAAYANCCIPSVVHALGRARPWGRVALIVLLVVLVLTIVLSQSRAGMLLLALLLLGLMLGQRRARGYTLLVAAALGLVALALPRVYWVRFESMAQFRGIVVDRSLQLRQHALEGGWQLFLDNPWFGVGLGNFPDHAPHFMFGGFMAHNSLLEVAASLGVVGGLAYIGLLVAGWRMARRAAKLWASVGRGSERGLAGTLGLAIVVFALGASSLSIPFYPIVWVLLGLANAARRAAERDAAASLPA